jgi:hypothetical protein
VDEKQRLLPYTIGMIQIIPLLTAFGLGSIMSILIQSWLAQRSKLDERAFHEKQAAYIGLIEAYHRAAVEGSDEAAKAFAYWQMRCELVASVAVRDAISRVVETNDDRPARFQADYDMKTAMRADLGITK